MPTKPNAEVRGAYEAARSNPDFGHDALEAIINDSPEIASALLDRGLVEEVKQ